MQNHQSRLDSFSKAIRVKNSSLTSSSSVKWPHPSSFVATPSKLADAGFYFDPSWEDWDNVTCFMCGKGLADWASSDDPFDIHWSKCKATCVWAVVKCGLRDDVDEDGRYVFKNRTRFPAGKAMEKARMATFTAQGSWPHDAVKNHGASSEKMAQAGFVYTPINDDDTATCLYCDISLGGWAPEDDPLQEHEKRKGKSGVLCPFFASTTTAPTSKAKGAAAVEEGEGEPSKRRSTRGAVSKAGSVIAPKPKSKSKPRAKLTRSKSKARAVAESEEEWDVATPAPVATAPVSKAKSKSKPAPTPEFELEPEPTEKPRTVKKGRKKKPSKEVGADEEAAVEMSQAEPEPAPEPMDTQPLPSTPPRPALSPSPQPTTPIANGHVHHLLPLSPIPQSPPAPPSPGPPFHQPATQTFLPPLALLPISHIVSLSETEQDMTVEEWIRHEISVQYEQLKSDGERRINAFREKAEEVRRRIDAL